MRGLIKYCILFLTVLIASCDDDDDESPVADPIEVYVSDDDATSVSPRDTLTMTIKDTLNIVLGGGLPLEGADAYRLIVGKGMNAASLSGTENGYVLTAITTGYFGILVTDRLYDESYSLCDPDKGIGLIPFTIKVKPAKQSYRLYNFETDVDVEDETFREQLEEEIFPSFSAGIIREYHLEYLGYNSEHILEGELQAVTVDYHTSQGVFEEKEVDGQTHLFIILDDTPSDFVLSGQEYMTTILDLTDQYRTEYPDREFNRIAVTLTYIQTY